MNLEGQTEMASIRQRRAWPVGPGRYLTGILGGVVAALIVFCAVYAVLYGTGNLPPPPLSNKNIKKKSNLLSQPLL